MRVVSLGSGSSGNALLVQAGQTAVLVDAGFPARALVSRLRQVGVAPQNVSAIFLTHEHNDHACGAMTFARQYGAALIADPRTLVAVMEREARSYQPEARRAAERVEMAVGRTATVGSLTARSFPISHDAVAPCGYVISSGAWRVCLVTDTGVIDQPIIEAMVESSLLVVESNHDRQRLISGPYPWHLKQRILSPTGHLANDQTGEALLRVLDDSPRWVWLAHLSRTNNTPDLARAYLRERLREVGLSNVAPQVAPPGMGPVWDSATLWGAADTREAPAMADALTGGTDGERGRARRGAGGATGQGVAAAPDR
ncbi:MAG TPA: MBL fold metallo-hydrolase [Ktedonobacterales bacterium]|nr:MBL fold metallo-hydrolase [Ktedonobacterales bacterium]